MERKLATVVFVDLVDSTSLVSREDPEIVRRRVTRYFERAAHCIEHHGGIVEKFAGDAVMAAFGIPRAHEDDAERAVRAAFAVMDAVAELGLEARIGVEAGEVVVDDGDSTFATGEAVNLAARLQQVAAAGEIVLGPGARRLTAGAVEAQDVGPLAVRGRAEPIWTWRAVRVLDGARRRPRSAPFVGREPELELLENAFARTVRDHRAHLVTVFGDPGVGKSRLVREFVDGVERATVLFGRALPYGEGVIYWPLATMIKASAGIADDDPAAEAFDKLRVCCESDAVADLLAAALGVLGAAEGERTSDEVAWAALQWAEQLADAQPLVLVFEDAHWADDRMLDLVEQLARSLRTSPVLLVTITRPELVTARPSWGGGNLRALAIDVGPLSRDESGELADALLGGADVPAAQRALLLDKAEGNPLFLEETARVLIESGGVARIPDTVHALIAARIDALDRPEKTLVQRAAVIGRGFWQGALERLSPDLDVAPLLDALLDRELIVHEDRTTITGDRAFRFRNVLIRDVAYASLTKAQRATHHRAFAEWLAERASDELVEIRGYHLDQASSLVAELDGEVPPELAREGASVLEEAGRRALRRGSFVAARRLLMRSAELDETLTRRYLAAHAGWRLGDVPSLDTEVHAVLEAARAADVRDVLGRALVLRAEITLHRDDDTVGARELAVEALELLPEDETAGRYDAHAVLATVGWWTGDAASCREHLEAMLALAEEMQRRDLESLALTQLAGLVNAALERDEAAELLARALELAEESGSREAVGFARAFAGRSVMSIDPEAAERELRAAAATFEEIGAAGRHGWALAHVGNVVAATGDAERAEPILRDAVRRLRATHEAGFLHEAERQLAEVLVARGQLDEAERLLLGTRDAVGADDVWTRASTRFTLGKLRAAQGRLDEAVDAMREAHEIVEPTMYRFFADEIARELESIGAPATSAGSS